MDIDRLLYSYVTDGIARNHKHHVGIELEFPLVSLEGGEVSPAVATPLFDSLAPLGYAVSRRNAAGAPLAAKHPQGHTLTFDTCYENVEFASASAPDFWSIYQVFRDTLRAAQDALRPLGYALLGVGYNSMLVKPHLVESELTLAIAEYFREHPQGRSFTKDFYCMVSSEQVHFNTTPEELPSLIEAFTRLDWINIMLFANSPAQVAGEKYLCARNELYMRSAFRALGLVGAQPLGFHTAEELARSYGDVWLFMREREGKSQVFAPVPVREYFARPDARPEDIHCLDLERNIVTTAYGTVEYRILCAQPFGEAFVPSAFNTGLRQKLPETLALARAFDRAHDMPEPNERNREASMGQPTFADHKDILAYAHDLLSLAQEGLRERGFGEERMLAPLERRDKLTDSPAIRLLKRERAIGARKALLERAELGDDLTK